jgi:hypothetical protein
VCVGLLSVFAVGLSAACGERVDRTASGGSGSAAPAFDVEAFDTAGEAFVSGSQLIYGDKLSVTADVFAAEAGTPFGSELAPLAQRTADGVLYLAAPSGETFEGGGLRFVDASRDQLILESAASFAISRDGKIGASTVKGGTSTIVALDGPNGPSSEWFQSEHPLVVLAWSGAEVLVLETFGDSGEPPNLYSIGSNGAARLVKEAASLLAVSPDGQLLLLDTIDPASGSNVAAIVEADTFAQVGVLRPAGRGDLVVGQSEWSTAGIVATVWVDGTPALAVFKPEGGDYILTEEVALPDEILYGLVHPRLDATGSTVTAWAWDSRVRAQPEGGFLSSPYLAVECSFAPDSCTVTTFGSPTGQISRVFSDPSTTKETNP